MKVCTKCKLDKEEAEFHLDKKGLRGRCARCKQCISAHHKSKRVEYGITQRQYFIKNKDKVYEWAKNYRDKHPDKLALSKGNYYKNNKKKSREWSRASEKKATENISEFYLRKKLLRIGYSKHEIEEHPELLDIKKIKIIIHRLKNKQ